MFWFQIKIANLFGAGREKQTREDAGWQGVDDLGKKGEERRGADRLEKENGNKEPGEGGLGWGAIEEAKGREEGEKRDGIRCATSTDPL